MMRVSLFLLALVALSGGVLAQLTTEELSGEYDVKCVATTGPEETDWHYDSNAWLSNNQMREYAQIWDGAECDGTVQWEMDSSAFYQLGAERVDQEDVYDFAKFYRAGMKRVVARTEDAMEFLESTCDGVSFPLDQWVDVLEVTCPPLFWACSEQNYAEFTCVTRDSSGNLTFCETNQELGPCTVGTAGDTLQSRDYERDSDLSAPGDDDLNGEYGVNCVMDAGLPQDWRASEYLTVEGREKKWVHRVYSDPFCDQVALEYESEQSYTNGAFFEAFSDQVLPTFEQNNKFSRKVMRVNEDGQQLIQQNCGQLLPLDQWVDVSGLNCPPFLFSCGIEFSCVYQDPIDSSVRFCALNPVEGSCTVENRVAEYDSFTYAQDSAASLMCSALLVVAALLVAVIF